MNKNKVIVPKKSILKKMYSKLELNKASLGSGWHQNNC